MDTNNLPELNDMAVRFARALERMQMREDFKLLVLDYAYIYGDDLTLVIVDKNGRYISFDKAKHLADERLLISHCIADNVGSVDNTMILKLTNNTKGDFKTESGFIDIYKEFGE